ncbi:hypothetical protein HYFRA_00006830 [Hymenoscyphus fraxineus]|uniref:Uncharacterized protein n=1 Tax=Hymenoscyphus fraxineus TaxID=746836 RepID=A0A9N9KRP4_9HELO|nr:hypothetical protein HYFRA_00006830 [Hymenoscyphus fraxineus]
MDGWPRVWVPLCRTSEAGVSDRGFASPAKTLEIGFTRRNAATVTTFVTYTTGNGVNESGTTTPSSYSEEELCAPSSIGHEDEKEVEIRNPFKTLSIDPGNTSSRFHWNTEPAYYQNTLRAIEPRVYTFPIIQPIDIKSLLTSLQPLSSVPNSPPSPIPEQPHELTPSEIHHALTIHRSSRSFLAHCMVKEHENPFPGINMNSGWNRARCKGEVWWWGRFHDLRRKMWEAQNPDAFYRDFEQELYATEEYLTGDYGALQLLMESRLRENERKRDVEYGERADGLGIPEEVVRTRDGFGRFSFERQNTPFLIRGEDVEGMGFGMVFVGEAYGRRGLARVPGEWWASRKHVFEDFRGRSFLEEIEERAEMIRKGLQEWIVSRHENLELTRGFNELKRKKTDRIGVERSIMLWEPRGKKRKMCKKPEEVMSEEWRKKRRVQEKKAGRWTDGTERMNMMWAQFHWVLNKEPEHVPWPTITIQTQPHIERRTSWCEALVEIFGRWFRMALWKLIWDNESALRLFRGGIPPFKLPPFQQGRVQ